VTLDWASEMLKNQPDTALMEYQQQLWQSLGQVKSPEDRRRLLNLLERLNTGGRAALYDMVEGADAWPPPAPRDVSEHTPAHL
jgi:hypothetical protein